MNDPLRIPVLVGSVRRGRQSIKVARFARDRLRRAGAEAPLLDLADFDLPIMEERLYRRDDPPPGLDRFSEAIREADAVVIVSPEYNGSMPGVVHEGDRGGDRAGEKLSCQPPCPQKRSAVRARVRVTVSSSAMGTHSSGRWALRTSPGPNITVGVCPTFTSSCMSAP